MGRDRFLSVAVAALLMLPAACRGGEGAASRVTVDGSSTVYPITQTLAERFREEGGEARISVGVSGTGGGFEKFCRGETDIQNASRPIREAEQERCEEAGIDYVELPVAWDGITVAVHPDNDWVEAMTVEELRRIWRPEAKGEIGQWSDVRDGWPDRPLRLYGPGVDSGTYDYFTRAIVGEAGSSRGDYTANENDNFLVRGISGDPDALGYFGYAYYVENRDALRAIAIDADPSDDQGPVAPSAETIESGAYRPLSRPVFIYVRKAALEREPIREFATFYLEHARDAVPDAGYVPLGEQAAELARERLERREVGTVFADEDAEVGVSLEQVLREDR